MKNIRCTQVAGLMLLAWSLCISFTPSQAQTFSNKVNRNNSDDAVPRTKSQVIDYLAKMRRIINRYDSSMMGMMTGGGGGLQLDPANAERASERTQQLSQDIAAVVPPAEIAAEHNKYANAMGSVQNFMAAGGNSLAAMPTAFALAGQVQQSHTAYRNAVLKMIDAMSISRTMDPFSDENEGAKAQAAEGLSNLKGQLTGDMNFGGGGTGADAAAKGSSSGAGLAGSGLTGSGIAGSGMAERSGVLSSPTVLGGSGNSPAAGAAGGLGGLGGLGALLGGMGGGGQGGFAGLGGGGAGEAGLGGLGGGDLGSMLKNVDLNSLIKQFAGGQGGLGGGGGSAPANGGLPAGIDDN